MLVVADSSPLNVLVRLGYVDVLPKLFKVVIIPDTVRAELSAPTTPEVVQRFTASAPSWLVVETVVNSPVIEGIDAGEAAAIYLAQLRAAEFLLIDDKDGRREAVARGIPIIGTVGILGAASRVGLLVLSEAVEQLLKTDFRVDQRILEDALKRDAASRRQR